MKPADKPGRSFPLGTAVVALDPTLTNVAVFGVLVLIRTFLSWSLAVEIEGRWPWQARKENKYAVQPGE